MILAKNAAQGRTSLLSAEPGLEISKLKMHLQFQIGSNGGKKD